MNRLYVEGDIFQKFTMYEDYETTEYFSIINGSIDFRYTQFHVKPKRLKVQKMKWVIDKRYVKMYNDMNFFKGYYNVNRYKLVKDENELPFNYSNDLYEHKFFDEPPMKEDEKHCYN